MRAMITTLLLLLASPAMAFQGMGPGPGVKGYASGGGFATPARVQYRYTYGSSIAYSGAVTAGNLLVVAINGLGAPGTITVSDSVNGSWTQAGVTPGDSSQSSEDSAAIFYRANTASGMPTVTVTNSLVDRAITIMEFSGVATTSPLVGYQGQNAEIAGGSSSTYDTGSGISVDQTHNLVVAVYGNYTGAVASTYPNYTQIQSAPGDAGLTTFQRVLTDGSGSYDFTGTMASSNNAWTVCNAVFKAASL